MGGYIGLTTSEWIDTVKTNDLNSDVVFWCKKKSFKAIQQGEPFYFLKRGKFTSNMDRLIVGKASFSEFTIVRSSDAWSRYGRSLGFISEMQFDASIGNIYGSNDFDLGCIILKNPVFFSKSVPLGLCGVDFSPCIVSGKTITNSDCQKIDAAVGGINT